MPKAYERALCQRHYSGCEERLVTLAKIYGHAVAFHLRGKSE